MPFHLQISNYACVFLCNCLDLTIHKLFATRADMYRTVYTHPKVKAMELMHLCKEMIICRFQIPFKIQLNTGRL
ncbi:unnamed protein product [Lathyrus oleraceus]